MDDALLVRGLERLGDLPRDRQRVFQREPPARDDHREILALDELHHQSGPLASASGRKIHDAIDLRDVGMVQRGQRLRLACETREPIGIAREELRQDLDRDVAIEPGVARAEHFPHSAFAQLPEDLEDADSHAGDHEVLPGWASARPRRRSRVAAGVRAEAGPPAPIWARISY